MTIFPPSNNGGEGLAKWAGVPFLGRIPMMTSLEKAAESGMGLVEQGTHDGVVLSKIVNGKKQYCEIIDRNRVSCGTLDVLEFCLFEKWIGRRRSLQLK